MATPIEGKYVVGKSFERDGVRLESGTVVDVTGWRNANKLLMFRYLREARPGEVDAVEDPASPVAVVDEKPEKPVVKKAPAKKAAAKKAAPKKAN